MRRWLHMLGQAAKAWNDDNAFGHAAAVSFYTVFSLAPITLIVVAIVGFFFGQQIATQQFVAQVGQLVGRSGAELMQKAMEANATHGSNWLSSTVGTVVLAIGATTVFAQLQQSLNDVWGVTTKPSTSIWVILFIKRLISFTMVLVIGFLLLTSLILTTALTSAIDLAKSWITVPPWTLRSLDLVTSLVVITILFALIFKVLPDVQVGWRETWVGAFVTAVLFTVGRFGIALYLAHTTIASSYGAAGSLVALLIWIYYSCAIFFYGVEFVRAHHRALGLRVVPKETAVLVRREIVAAPPRARRA